MTQTITTYDALTTNTTITFKTKAAGYRAGIVTSVGPKIATITNLPGKNPFTARLSRANWNRYIVRQNAVDTTPNLTSTTDPLHLDTMPSGSERAALLRRNFEYARWFLRCANYDSTTIVLNRALVH